MAMILATVKLRLEKSSIFTIGSGTRRSHQTKMPIRIALATKSARMVGLVQPSRFPSMQGYYVYGDIEGWIGGFDIGNESSTFTVPHKGLLMTVSQAGGELYAGYADGKLFQITVVS